MALTPEERQKILDALDQEDRSSLEKILASFQSFLNWLMLVLYAIYLILSKDPDLLKKLFAFAIKFCL